MLSRIAYRLTNRAGFFWSLVIVCISVFLTACDKEPQADPVVPAESFYSFTTRAAGTINTDTRLWEDQVSEIRMLVFRSSTGALVYNQKLSFPKNFDNPSAPVMLGSDRYDFYFIANETAGGTGFVQALEQVGNKVQFNADRRFWNLAFNPAFKPDGNPGGTNRFVMSARYENELISPGGSLSAPLPFKGSGFKVSLVRAFAKLELAFRQLKENGQPTVKRVTSVELINVPRYYSAPAGNVLYSERFPADGLAASSYAVAFPAVNYTNDSIGTRVFYIPEFLRARNAPANGNTVLLIKGTGFNDVEVVLDHQNFADLNQPRDLDVSVLSTKSVIRNTHYIVTATFKGNKLESNVSTLPWQVDMSVMAFDKPSFLKPVVTGTGGVSTSRLLNVRYNEQLSFKFKLNSPEGAIWNATLTNGADFVFSSGASSVQGIAGTEYTFTITPARQAGLQPRKTELYITVNGEEIDLAGQGTGVGKRYVITQDGY